MVNNFIQVQGISIGGQVLTGEITPPSVGVNDYDVRILPGAAAARVGDVPATLTEIVSGATIQRKYGGAADSVVSVSEGRYGLRAVRNSGFENTSAITPKQYRTLFVVAQNTSSSGSADLVKVGKIVFSKQGSNWRLLSQATLSGATFQSTSNVEVLTFMSTSSGALVVSGNGTPTTSTAASNSTPDGGITVGTLTGYQDGANGVTLYDIIAFERELSKEEILTVRQSLQNIWNASPVGGIAW